MHVYNVVRIINPHYDARDFVLRLTRSPVVNRDITRLRLLLIMRLYQRFSVELHSLGRPFYEVDCFTGTAPRVGSRALKNKPTSFPGRVLYEATEPG